MSTQQSAHRTTPEGSIQRFEDLLAWQKARELTRAIYQVTRQGAFARDYGLAGQIQRAAVSVMSNAAEGFERYHASESLPFYNTARASCGEVRSQLYVALDVGYLDQETFDSLMALAEETGRLVGGLRARTERKRDEQRARK